MSSRSSIAASKGVATRKIPLATLVAVVASIAANLIVLFGLSFLVEYPAGFQPLTAIPVALFTTIGVVGAGIAFAIVARLARNPVGTYRLVALIALVLSIIPNILLVMNPASAPMPGGTSAAYGVLIVFHVVAALVSVSVITGMTNDRKY